MQHVMLKDNKFINSEEQNALEEYFARCKDAVYRISDELQESIVLSELTPAITVDTASVIGT